MKEKNPLGSKVPLSTQYRSLFNDLNIIELEILYISRFETSIRILTQELLK